MVYYIHCHRVGSTNLVVNMDLRDFFQSGMTQNDQLVQISVKLTTRFVEPTDTF